MNGIESIIQTGQPMKAGSGTVPEPLQNLMGLVKYLMSKNQAAAAPPGGTIAEGIAGAVASDMMPQAEEPMMDEPDIQDVRDTALPAMRQDAMQDQRAMQEAAQQIQAQNRPPAGITSLDPDIIPLRAGGILGYDDGGVVGFSPGGLTPFNAEFGGVEGSKYQQLPYTSRGEAEYQQLPDEPRVEAFGPGGKRGRFTADELRQMGYPEEEIKRRFALQQGPAKAAATPATPPAAPAKPPMNIVRAPNAPGGPAAQAPAMAAPPPEAPNPYEKDVRAGLDRTFDMEKPTAGGIAAERKAALEAAGIKGPAGQAAEQGIAQLEKLFQQQEAAREEDKKGRAMRGLQEFLLAGARGGKAWQNLANAGRGGLAYKDRMKAQDAAYDKLKIEQQKLMIDMKQAVEGARRAEANGDFKSYEDRMNQYQQARRAFENNQKQLAGQAFQVAEQAATRREATAARRDIADQQAKMRAALAQGKGVASLKPLSPRDELALRDDVRTKFFSGAVTPEMRQYLMQSEDGKRVLNDIANKRVKYDPNAGWGAAEPAIARAAELYRRDLMSSIGRGSGIPSADQALRDLAGGSQ
jgi:hypothetical protein